MSLYNNDIEQKAYRRTLRNQGAFSLCIVLKYQIKRYSAGVGKGLVNVINITKKLSVSEIVIDLIVHTIMMSYQISFCYIKIL